MRTYFLAVILLALSTSAARADFEAGMNAYSMGNFEAAAREFKLSALRGETQGEYYLGLLYEEGQGLEQDHGQALYWYHKAAARGDVDAAFALGRMYAAGQGVKQDRPTAYAWFSRAAQGGHYLGKQEKANCANRMSPEQLQAARLVVLD